MISLTTDSVAKNKRVAGRYGIEFPILSDPAGEVLKAIGMWDSRWKIARYGYILLDPELEILSRHRGSWRPSDDVKQFFLDSVTAQPALRGREPAALASLSQ